MLMPPVPGPYSVESGMFGGAERIGGYPGGDVSWMGTGDGEPERVSMGLIPLESVMPGLPSVSCRVSGHAQSIRHARCLGWVCQSSD